VAYARVDHSVEAKLNERLCQQKTEENQNRKWGEEKFGNHAEAGVFLQFFWQLRLEIHL
jgi:hypothetical protein